MPDQHGLGDNGTESTRLRQSGQGDDQMKEYDSEVAHSGNGINTSKITALRPIWQLAIDRCTAPQYLVLLTMGCDEEPQANELEPDGGTPIMFAARSGNVAAIQVLLDHHADINATEPIRGTTPLMWAAEQGASRSHKDLTRARCDCGRRFSSRYQGKQGLRCAN